MPGCITRLLAIGLAILLAACSFSTMLSPTPTPAPRPTVTGIVWCSDQLPDRECAALYQLTGKVFEAPCDGAGRITCEDGHITRIDYRQAKITRIPESIKDLPYLKELRLFGNRSLAGPLPPELFTLKDLEILDLGDTQISGPIPPELGALSRLRYLNLDMNNLTGPIPPELGNLTRLEYLHLLGNRLTGPIPPELGNLTRLKELHLGHNHLTGPIPPELGNLTQLEKLYLHDNQLSGPIPPELGRLRLLEDLYLRQNRLTGAVPELSGLKHLARLDISFNPLEGDVPDNLSSTVQMFWHHQTQLTETVTSAWPEDGPLRSAAVRYEDFDCTHVNTLRRKECEALLAIYLPLDENAHYYSGVNRLTANGRWFPGNELDGSRAVDNRDWLRFPLFVSPDPCDWFTVRCEHGYVESFYLGYGPVPKQYRLPPEVANLTHARFIVLRGETPICYTPGSAAARWLETIEAHPPDLLKACGQPTLDSTRIR